ncbi:hypothetical protein A6M23_10445 [Acidithiobacillus thiooxidans]|uniref:Uncharacterized protein n=3 Tax=Acidithiobacillaceae TaxID=225058 RepID=A0A1C2I7S8_ACITH|nr:hypothetical protein [Acidithiobacillus sp.]OCX72066.1 hypothetical protein A6M23_10445 [Acidithiobacillus thiooxidans]OCX80063.1 hypothetical protein A6P08_17065 [Acidithiobacillus thiooxidans]QFX95944.1 hypothetical protein GCD22_01642 [Acidithiobacillus thiooxidans ATCC 19377]
MLRSAMFTAFELAGLLTPRHGLVRDLVPVLRAEYVNYPEELWQMMQVVVHIDGQAHAGEGKLALSYAEALAEYPKQFVVEFLPTANIGSVSYRYLRIGLRTFFLRSNSLDDWRSNCGDTRIEYLGSTGSINPETTLFFDLSPMIAIDYVQLGKTFLALDLNIAPGLEGTGVDKAMPPVAIFETVAEWFSVKRPSFSNLSSEKRSVSCNKTNKTNKTNWIPS